MKYRPTLLAILDGWGFRNDQTANAIALAHPTFITHLAGTYPSTHLEASGESVGLPAGLMGNSEVGHLNLGAGRIVYQDILRISKSIDDGSFFQNRALLDVFQFAASRGGKIHLMGLQSDGGVHSALKHLLGLLEMAYRQKVKRLFVHGFLDGRDSPPKSALPFIEKIEKEFRRIGTGAFGVIVGRYFAMDRDQRWERLEKAYRALVPGEGRMAASAVEALEKAYERGESDEFVEPTIVAPHGKIESQIEDGDGVIFYDFRADRARQLTCALTQDNFSGFKIRQPDIAFCGMTEYDATFHLPAAFGPEKIKNTIAEVWSKAGLRQFHVAETEKYAHVTYFFSGGREEPFPGEDRLLIPSPKVATYDQEPEMSALAITEACLERIAGGNYDCIVVNFANADMVGHTGNLEATEKAVKIVDEAVGKLADAILDRGGLMVVTADHGNAEMMSDPKSGQAHTAHTTSLVPLLMIGKGLEGRMLQEGGKLADVAPTILDVEGIPVPSEMTGKSLLLERAAKR